MEKNKHLSLKGIGPAYVITITVISALFIFLGTLLPTIPLPDILLKVLGIFLIIEGVYIWLMAVKKSKITEKIKNNTLVTDGIYSYVRNPIYSAFMIVEWGILLILGNPLLGIAIPLYWGLMTIMVKKTEEKWLLELYGDSFKEYCKSVNRCIPWIKNK